jgi:2TM domain-containing protein
MSEPITLQEYEAAEQSLEAANALRGVLIHATITVLVAVALIVVNVVVAPQFPWSPFPVVGMGIGLLVHYLFGLRWLERSIATHQKTIEQHAAQVRKTGPMPV